MRGVLLVGNFLSGSGLGRNVIEDLADRLRLADVPLVCASTYGSRCLRGLDMLATTIYRRRRYSVAVVDLFSGWAFAWGTTVSMLLRVLRCPHVFVLHGGGLPMFASRHGRLVRWCLGMASRVVAPSSFLQIQMRPYRSDVALLPNPIDLTQFRCKGRSSVAPRLVWVRAFHSIYRPWLAVEVVALLRATCPGVQLTMIGPDKGDGSLARTRQMVQELGVSDRVTFVGPIPHADVPKWLDSEAIFVNTTDVDNTPVSVMEAMAAGLCIVSTNVGGVPALVQDGEEALLVPPADAPAMAAAVRRFVDDDELAGRVSAAARRKAESWDWSVILPRWLQLLGELVATDSLAASRTAPRGRP